MPYHYFTDKQVAVDTKSGDSLRLIEGWGKAASLPVGEYIFQYKSPQHSFSFLAAIHEEKCRYKLKEKDHESYLPTRVFVFEKSIKPYIRDEKGQPLDKESHSKITHNVGCLIASFVLPRHLDGTPIAEIPGFNVRFIDHGIKYNVSYLEKPTAEIVTPINVFVDQTIRRYPNLDVDFINLLKDAYHSEILEKLVNNLSSQDQKYSFKSPDATFNQLVVYEGSLSVGGSWELSEAYIKANPTSYSMDYTAGGKYLNSHDIFYPAQIAVQNALGRCLTLNEVAALREPVIRFGSAQIILQSTASTLVPLVTPNGDPLGILNINQLPLLWLKSKKFNVIPPNKQNMT